MKFKKINEREQNREVSRRALLGWMTAAGACLSVPAWKVKEIIEGTHGKAFAVANQRGRRYCRIDLGVGGLAWMTQLTPHRTLQGTTGRSYLFEGQGRLASGTDKPLFLSPAGELMAAGLEGRIGGMPSVFRAGRDQTHTRVSTCHTTTMNGRDVPAQSGVFQIANTHLLPALNVNNSNFGNAPGAPNPVALNNANAMVSTFQSAATDAQGILFDVRDAELYDANMTALLKLKKAVNRPTMDKGIKASQVSGQVVGLDIGKLLEVTDNDRVAYGLDQGSGGDGRIQGLATFLIVAAKMIKLALVSNFSIQAFNDDPHGAYNNVGNSQQFALSLGRVFNAFWSDMANTVDPLGDSNTLAQEVVMQVTGDTVKNPENPAGWGDGSRGSSTSWVWGAGATKTGDFGGLQLGNGGHSFDPQTGDEDTNRSAQQNQEILAHAVLFAVAQADAREADNASGGISSDYPGILNFDVDG